MPFLDVSDIILDADFCESVTLLRRVEAINEYGESEITPASSTLYCVVLPGQQKDAERGEDGQTQPNNIEVHSVFRLVGPAESHQPDIITWGGRQFVVMRTYDYSKYGRGFVRADCTSIDYLDSV